MRHLAFLLIFLFSAPGVFAQAEQSGIENQLKELKAMIGNLQKITQEQNKRIEELEIQNVELRQKSDIGQAQTAAPQSAASQAPLTTGLQAFNPEIGVVGDVVATSSESKEDAEGNDRIAVRELELVLGIMLILFRFDATAAFPIVKI